MASGRGPETLTGFNFLRPDSLFQPETTTEAPRDVRNRDGRQQKRQEAGADPVRTATATAKWRALNNTLTAASEREDESKMRFFKSEYGR